jgi:hypothetical protein
LAHLLRREFTLSPPYIKRAESCGNFTLNNAAASTIPLVPSVLTEGENYGCALIQRVRELCDGRVEGTEGMLSRVLHLVEKEQ